MGIAERKVELTHDRARVFSNGILQHLFAVFATLEHAAAIDTSWLTIKLYTIRKIESTSADTRYVYKACSAARHADAVALLSPQQLFDKLCG